MVPRSESYSIENALGWLIQSAPGVIGASRPITHQNGMVVDRPGNDVGVRYLK